MMPSDDVSTSSFDGGILSQIGFQIGADREPRAGNVAVAIAQAGVEIDHRRVAGFERALEIARRDMLASNLIEPEHHRRVRSLYEAGPIAARL